MVHRARGEQRVERHAATAAAATAAMRSDRGRSDIHGLVRSAGRENIRHGHHRRDPSQCVSERFVVPAQGWPSTRSHGLPTRFSLLVSGHEHPERLETARSDKSDFGNSTRGVAFEPAKDARDGGDVLFDDFWRRRVVNVVSLPQSREENNHGKLDVDDLERSAQEGS